MGVEQGSFRPLVSERNLYSEPDVNPESTLTLIAFWQVPPHHPRRQGHRRAVLWVLPSPQRQSGLASQPQWCFRGRCGTYSYRLTEHHGSSSRRWPVLRPPTTQWWVSTAHSRRGGSLCPQDLVMRSCFAVNTRGGVLVPGFRQHALSISPDAACPFRDHYNSAAQISVARRGPVK